MWDLVAVHCVRNMGELERQVRRSVPCKVPLPSQAML